MDDRLIATAALEPGWEPDYEGRPPISSTVCVGRIVSHSQDEQDRHNILLLGVRRARVCRELTNDRPFREAEVRFMADYYSTAAADQRQKLKRQLLHRFPGLPPQNPSRPGAVRAAVEQRSSFGSADRCRRIHDELEFESQAGAAGPNECRPTSNDVAQTATEAARAIGRRAQDVPAGVQ